MMPLTLTLTTHPVAFALESDNGKLGEYFLTVFKMRFMSGKLFFTNVEKCTSLAILPFQSSFRGKSCNENYKYVD